MITEDYVSFETAKLLKEKGFDGECRMTYREHDMQMIYYTPNPNELLDFTTNRGKLEKHSKKQHCDYALCPTHQMALKWLREVHKIEIYISYGFPFINGKQAYKYFWSPIVVKEDGLEYPMDNPDTAEFGEEMADSYEQAVEAALKYTLENLV